jgi:predicted PurR-regulated permease PerM
MPPPGRLDAPDWTVRRVRASWSSVLLAIAAVVAVLVARGIFVAASQPIGWVAAAAAVAVVISPVVDLQARWIPRVAAILLTLVVGVALVASVGVASVMEVQDQLGQLRESLPAAAAELEAGQGPDGMFRQLGAESLVQDLVDQMTERVSPSPTVDDAAGTAPAFFVSGVLVIFLLIWGQNLFDGLVRQVSDHDRREWFATWATESLAVAQRYIARSIALAVVVGAIGAGLAWWAGMATPLVLGVVLAVASLIPYVGIVFGAVPMLLLSAGFEPLTVTIVLGLALLALQGAATVVMRRLVEARSLRVGPAIIVIAALIGSDVYGTGGALVAVVAAIVAVALIEHAADELGPATAPTDGPAAAQT